MFKIGTPLTLEKMDDSGEITRFRCKIVEKNETNIFVDYPINEITGRTNIFPIETEFQVNFVGEDNSVYRFSTIITGKQNINIPTLILDYPKDGMTRIQRREYVRIETAVDAAIHDPNELIEPFTTITQDISGGGISVLLPKRAELKPGIKLDIWLVLPMDSGGFEYVYAESQVIRVHHRNNGQKDLLSLKFATISDKDRQAIIRYCFERQLRARRRGLK